MKSILLWTLALVVTLASAVYQKKTGPTYAVRSSCEISGSIIDYKLDRTHAGPGDQAVTLNVPDTTVQGLLFYKRYKTNDDWTKVRMERVDENLTGTLPHQPPAGKLEYYVELLSGVTVESLPTNNTVITRFRGDVPGFILAPHIFFMFFGMLLSFRAGLEALRKEAKLKGIVILTTCFIFIGGMILGPIVQKYAFGAYWTGFPFGMDLTDNKTLIAMIGWILALVGTLVNYKPKLLTGIAAVITLFIFLIPHSMAGSELDYSKLDAGERVIKSGSVR
jgi:hypothetical protein